MRVVLIGSEAARARLRAQLPSEMQVVGEFPTAADARRSGTVADAVLSETTGADRVDPPPVAVAGRSRGDADLDEAWVEALTPRESQVLAFVAQGLSNRAIAERLSISDQTVKFHVASIMGKLGTANRVETVRRAVRLGLITL
ncbi:MAG TPA: response regulator transcription factor [Vicinamibacterales bacterium]